AGGHGGLGEGDDAPRARRSSPRPALHVAGAPHRDPGRRVRWRHDSHRIGEGMRRGPPGTYHAAERAQLLPLHAHAGRGRHRRGPPDRIRSFHRAVSSMTQARRGAMISLLLFGGLVLTATSCSQTPKRPAVAEQIAKTYGLDSFGQIDTIRYTFNAEFPGVNLSRSWVWQPKTGQVS